jgi:predicted esterase
LRSIPRSPVPVSHSLAMNHHHLPITRHARYFTLGPGIGPVHELWYVLHGYGQLAQYFLRSFAPIDNGNRLIVAPEALSRFYLDAATAGLHAERVGASWMTREDREQEIADYVAYLDGLDAHVCEGLGGRAPVTRVLGFSQGAATGTRWVLGGRVPADELILWGGAMANEVNLDAPPDLLRRLRVTLVVGSEDRMLDRDLVTRQAAGLQTLGPRHRLVEYGGGHRVDPEVLAQLAASPAP